MIYLRLFCEFFKTGLLSIGGALATLPFLYELSDQTKWFSHAELANMLAVSESTPGPMGVNMASYVGFEVGGIPGAILATLGLITPSVIVILLIASFLMAFRSNHFVNDAFYGLRPASTGLIASAGVAVVVAALFNWELFQKTGAAADLFHWRELLLAGILLTLTRCVKGTKKLHPIVFIALSALAGIVFHLGGV
ncbi:MAG: chromate transporter [Ruthenibacterium sp.]